MFVWDILGNDFQYAENPRITIIYRVHNSLQSLPFSVSASAPPTHTSFHLSMEPSPNLEGQVMKKKRVRSWNTKVSAIFGAPFLQFFIYYIPNPAAQRRETTKINYQSISLYDFCNSKEATVSRGCTSPGPR